MPAQLTAPAQATAPAQVEPPPPVAERPAGQAVQGGGPAASDEALTQAVTSALEADPNYYFRHVRVRVDHGVATLSGYVGSGAAINRARTIATKVPGITRVSTNHLQVDAQLRR